MTKVVQPPLKNAKEILLTRGRSYIYREHYIQLHVFTKWWMEVDILTVAYGGNWYKHGSGYTWVLSRLDSIISITTALLDDFPSRTGFEKKILHIFPLENKTPPD